jgi:hypothetical protein
LERRVRLAARFVAPACRQAGFFIEPQPEKVGVLFLLERRVRLAARFVAPACRQAGFFIEPQPEKVGVLLFIGTTCLFR